MILANHLKEYNYADLLICDIHKEYPLSAPATVLWDPDAMSNLCDHLDPRTDDAAIHTFADTMFKGRVEGFDDWASIWRVKGPLEQIRSVFDSLARDLMGGPRGADDDTYDYWPNAFDMLIALAKDLIILYREYDRDPYYMLDTIDRVIQSAISLQGPLEEWEAEELPRALNNLRNLDKERS